MKTRNTGGSGLILLAIVVAAVCAIANLYPWKYFFIGLGLLIGIPLGIGIIVLLIVIIFIAVKTYIEYNQEKKTPGLKLQRLINKINKGK